MIEFESIQVMTWAVLAGYIARFRAQTEDIPHYISINPEDWKRIYELHSSDGHIVIDETEIKHYGAMPRGCAMGYDIKDRPVMYVKCALPYPMSPKEEPATPERYAVLKALIDVLDSDQIRWVESYVARRRAT